MKFSYNWLQTYFKSRLPNPDALAELFASHVCEVEGIESRGGDYVIDLKILPDKAHYLLCHRGLAQEIKTLTNLEMNNMAHRALPEKGGALLNILNENTHLCRRYMAREMDGLKVGESPRWLRERLEVIGQKGINLVVDAANYVMFDIGQPLHAFDADKIQGSLTIRLAKPQEETVLLTGQKINLTEEDLIIADDSGPLAIAGIKGGQRAEVSPSTKKIILEAANFDPAAIRKTSTRLNLRNDSSKRFENEITQELAPEAMRYVIALIADLSPGAVAGVLADNYPCPVNKWEIVFSRAQINSFLGDVIDTNTIEDILKKTGCEVIRQGEQFKITPPYERLDITIPEDVADEIGRILGYDKLSAKTPPKLDNEVLPDKLFYYSEKLKNELVFLGYSEVLLYSLVSKGIYQVINPLSSDKSSLREGLSQKLAEALILNSRNADLLSLVTIKVFEIGKVFTASGERTMLSMGVAQAKKKGTSAETILKEDIYSLEKSLGIPIAYSMKTEGCCAICEIDFDNLIDKLPKQGSISSLGFVSLPKNKKYQQFSSYPFIARDIAVFVPGNVTERDVQNIISKTVGPLCVKYWLFDVFTKEFPEGEKTSYAFRLVFQSPERTLEDQEVNAIMKILYDQIQAKAGWQVR